MAETNGLHRDHLVLPIQPRTIQPSLSHKEEEQLAAQPFRQESSPDTDSDEFKKRRKQRRRRCCACCCLGSLLVVAAAVVTLALMVFRSKDPKITVNSTTLKSLGIDTDPRTKQQRYMNATVLSEMSIKNPNKAASFKFGDSDALISYGGLTVGRATIPAGKIKADRTAHMNVTATVFLGNLTSNSSLLAGAMSGNMTIISSARIPGRINVLHIIKRHVIVTSVCNITVNISGMTTKVEHCSRHLKL